MTGLRRQIVIESDRLHAEPEPASRDAPGREQRPNDTVNCRGGDDQPAPVRTRGRHTEQTARGVEYRSALVARADHQVEPDMVIDLAPARLTHAGPRRLTRPSRARGPPNPAERTQRQTAMARLRRCRRGDLDRGIQPQCNDIGARIAARTRAGDNAPSGCRISASLTSGKTCSEATTTSGRHSVPVSGGAPFARIPTARGVAAATKAASAAENATRGFEGPSAAIRLLHQQKMGAELRLRASRTIGRVTGCRPGYSAGSRNGGINPKLRHMPFDSALDVPEDLDPYSARIVHAVARVGPAVAHIAVRDQNGRARGHGSGVVFAPDGFVLTNHHVIENGDRFSVSLPDG